MKIGVIAPLSNRTADPATMARACEARGFESYFIGEHTAVPIARKTARPSSGGDVAEMPDWYYELPAPFVALSFAAAATSTLRIGTGICLVAEHHPLELAKTVATLDRYSNGRFMFGIGSGWNAEEAALFNIDFKRRWAVTRDYVQAMIKLWTELDASHDGEFVNFPAVRILPKPTQKPYPPIHIGAFVNIAIKDVVTYGSGWMPGVGSGLLSVDDISRKIHYIKRRCEIQGRDFNEIEFSFIVYEDAEPTEIIDRYAALGAHRLILYCPGQGGKALDYGVDGMNRRLDEIANGYLNAC